MVSEFLWGAATSAYQVEGGNNNDWTEWEKRNAKHLALSARRLEYPQYILDNHPNPLQEENYISDRTCDHYHRFREDFDIAKSLGHNAHRFSIEWSRIEPEEGRFNEKEIKHYRSIVGALRSRGLEPFVTIWHWTLPIWLKNKGGVINKNFPAYFRRYSEVIVSALGGVKFWTTINEPEIYAANSYLVGKWPPQKKNLFSYLATLNNLIESHKLAFGAIKSIRPSAKVGIAKNNIYFEAAGKNPVNRLLKKAADWWWNSGFLEAIKNKLDFIGLNYYFHNRINWGFNKNLNKKTTDMEWEIYPEGIYCVLKDLTKYKLPIYITENGLADMRNAERADFIKEHVRFIEKAEGEGVDVRGYFHWSLLDNFEWDKGFWPRFGLVEVNYKTLVRKIRPSALVYKKIISESLLNQ
jgi:beta-glucosidase